MTADPLIVHETQPTDSLASLACEGPPHSQDPEAQARSGCRVSQFGCDSGEL